MPPIHCEVGCAVRIERDDLVCASYMPLLRGPCRGNANGRVRALRRFKDHRCGAWSPNDPLYLLAKQVKATPDYRVRYSPKAKNPRLKMTRDEGLCVVVPRGYDEKKIPALLKQKKVGSATR